MLSCKVHWIQILLSGSAWLLSVFTRLFSSCQHYYFITGIENNNNETIDDDDNVITFVSSQELKSVPRTEAVSIVGSLLSYPSIFPSLNILMPAPDQLSLVSSRDLQDQVGDH